MKLARLRQRTTTKSSLRSSCRAARLLAAGVASFAAASVMLATVPLQAGTYTWAVAAGDWSVATNWGGTLPTSHDTAYIVNGGTATITKAGAVCYTLWDGIPTGDGNCLLSGSGVLTTSDCICWGSFSQAGGTDFASYLADYGTYTLSGTGVLDTGEVDVGAGTTVVGLFQQSGGTNNVGCVNVYNGRYVLTGGLLQPNGILNSGVIDGGNSVGAIAKRKLHSRYVRGNLAELEVDIR